ncbi:MAG: hypothetical protein BMS9Abin05_0466 [Rhodothermia bacterium]|nr:MAG: hypothetical protein BMS9Abin05_0466 [Rhodothermia bacterium]
MCSGNQRIEFARSPIVVGALTGGLGFRPRINTTMANGDVEYLLTN